MQTVNRHCNNMFRNPVFGLAVLTTLAVLAVPPLAVRGQRDLVENDYERPGASPVEILRARGFLADEFFVNSQGNKLSVTRGRNPLIKSHRREPILFIHGTISSASIWLVNSRGARPRDFRNLTRAASSADIDQLYKLVGSDPSATNLALLALNFGHEIWLFNRRGTLRSDGRFDEQVASSNRSLLGDASKSLNLAHSGLFPTKTAKGREHFVAKVDKFSKRLAQLGKSLARPLRKSKGHEQGPPSNSSSNSIDREHDQLLANLLQPYINLPGALVSYGHLVDKLAKTFDVDYWNFSLDEQAEFDVPAVIDFILAKTRRPKLIAVGHSAGGGLILLANSVRPELANKISKAILWAPAANLGHGDIDMVLMLLTDLLKDYTGPFLPSFASLPFRGLLQVVCSSVPFRFGLCELLSDTFLGFSGGQQPMTDSLLSIAFEPISSMELKHLTQFSVEPRPRKFKFNTQRENIEAYGQPEPPEYDLSRIRLTNLSMYTGITDILVSPADLRTTVRQLKVPCKHTQIGGGPTLFNHVGYYNHLANIKLAILPTLRDILGPIEPSENKLVLD